MQEYIMITSKRPSPAVALSNTRQRELMRRARALQKRRRMILEEKMHAEAPKHHFPTWLRVPLHH